MSDYDNLNRDYCIQNYAQCNFCKNRACNSNHVEFEEKISCVKCTPDENSNCNVIDETATATECAQTAVGYKDMCYTLQKGGVSHRGCLYEAPNEIFVECENPFSEACVTCNQTNCNRIPIVNEDLELNPFHQVVREDFCYKCDSSVDPNCINQLNNSMIEKCDSTGEGLGCYHMITEAGVKRGCVQDLEKNLKKKCLANDDTCKICTDRECNSRSNFSECFVTNEGQRKELANLKSSSSPQICTKYDDKCFTLVLAGVLVVRGCLYDLQKNIPPNFLSAQSDKSFAVCSGRLCNDKVVEPSYCITCDSSNQKCIDDPYSMRLRKQCKLLEINPSGCYHFDNGTFIERGCILHLDEKRRSDCESDSDTCKKCVGNECNTKKKFLNCLSDVKNNGTHHQKVCRRYEDSCYILAKNDAIRRGCSSDLIDSPEFGFDFYSDGSNRDIFQKCKTENCNSRQIESENCMVCSSEDENQCKDNPTDDMMQKCPLRLRNQGCYLQLEGITKRGCVAELDIEDQNMCRIGNSTCKICNGDYCNKKPSFEICKTCSSKDDVNCINSPWASAEKTCPNYMDSCYTHVENGIVKRNCIGDDFVKSVEVCTNSKHCKPCSGGDSRCNGEKVVPEICFACDSLKNPKCKTLSLYEQQFFVEECPISIKKQGCYHYIDKNDQRHIRGSNEIISTRLILYFERIPRNPIYSLFNLFQIQAH